jgi:hypothetical protein
MITKTNIRHKQFAKGMRKQELFMFNKKRRLTINMTNESGDIELEPRKSPVDTNVSHRITPDDDSTRMLEVDNQENSSFSSSVRRLLSDESFNSPKQEGTVSAAVVQKKSFRFKLVQYKYCF